MTAQKHINAIGASIVSLEAKAKALRKAARDIDTAVQKLHELLDEAQRAYVTSTPQPVGGMIVPFSGGTNKPPKDDPDEPVEP